jgi:3,4-dihydroxy 2-butanone 4-phosphate synthase / GTP cyclohydrolase II
VSEAKTKPAGTKDLKTGVYQEGHGFLSSTADIIEDMRNGRMVILVDAEDRENEGDLVIPAQMATPDAINFMAKHGRGLICLSLTQARGEQLRLSSMVPKNASRTGTAFTVSIEAREGITTGISAGDRARTIATATDGSKGPDDITEASIDLARLAGLSPAAVICEIMNDDGTMARMPDLVAFAQRHGLKIGTIEDLIAFRLNNDRIVKAVVTRPIESVHGGAFDLHVYETTIDASEHLALVKGDLSKPGPVLVRVHAVNALADLLGVRASTGKPGDSGSLIDKSMQ